MGQDACESRVTIQLCNSHSSSFRSYGHREPGKIMSPTEGSALDSKAVTDSAEDSNDVSWTVNEGARFLLDLCILADCLSC